VAVWLILSQRARRLPPATGRESLIGAVGRTRTALEPEGAVFLEGELWRARTSGASVPAGADVRVVSVDGTTLVVEPVGVGGDASPPRSTGRDS
jgi:membrane-bound serine protease (ClpP class)